MKQAWRLLALLVTSLGLVSAQGTKPLPEALKYAAHVDLSPTVKLGADFWGRVIPLDGVNLRTESYLVVEVALFAPPGAKLSIDPGHFALKANGQALMPQSPGVVTIGMVNPAMRENRGPRLETDASVGPVIVSTGRDPVQARFPGDIPPNGTPVPPRAEPSSGVPQEPFDAATAVAKAALPAGSHATPISGYLFFPWSGKLKKLKQLELDYTSPLGTAALTLR